MNHFALSGKKLKIIKKDRNVNAGRNGSHKKNVKQRSDEIATAEWECKKKEEAESEIKIKLI